MAKKNATKRENPSHIPLSQPDRSGPDPSQKTLFALAEERGLLSSENHKLKNGKLPKNAVPIRPATPDEDLSRLGNSVLWSVSMAMLHFTFDVLTQHQYSEQIFWEDLAVRSAQAFIVILILFYTLHPFHQPPRFIPTLPDIAVKCIFFGGSVLAGCQLIHITNVYSYYHVLKQAPPLGVLWIWCIIELDLSWALWSLGIAVTFLQMNGYSITTSA